MKTEYRIAAIWLILIAISTLIAASVLINPNIQFPPEVWIWAILGTTVIASIGLFIACLRDTINYIKRKK